MNPWSRYAALAHRLDELRGAGELSEQDTVRRRAAAEHGLAVLDHRLGAQQQRLADLGRAIGQPVPAQPVGPVDVPDPETALRLAAQHADAADAAAQESERLAGQPPLLPHWPPVTRNLLVYGGCAAVAVLLQTALLIAGDVGRVDAFAVVAWACAGLPAMAFFAGYLIISVWGKAKLAVGTPVRSPRLGFAICFLAMPVVYCGYRVLISTF